MVLPVLPVEAALAGKKKLLYVIRLHIPFHPLVWKRIFHPNYLFYTGDNFPSNSQKPTTKSTGYFHEFFACFLLQCIGSALQSFHTIFLSVTTLLIIPNFFLWFKSFYYAFVFATTLLIMPIFFFDLNKVCLDMAFRAGMSLPHRKIRSSRFCKLVDGQIFKAFKLYPSFGLQNLLHCKYLQPKCNQSVVKWL